ncbi:unnamed protein product [Cylicocyclus nassatus]|uniref:Zinc finger protein n=1 Tax=Cylicocyclus nassatus TaxID=53992 RepID=A0AA36GKA3_CYLNA|nr:unnamed protein product [Cylicocyclus nassatus]
MGERPFRIAQWCGRAACLKNEKDCREVAKYKEKSKAETIPKHIESACTEPPNVKNISLRDRGEILRGQFSNSVTTGELDSLYVEIKKLTEESMARQNNKNNPAFAARFAAAPISLTPKEEKPDEQDGECIQVVHKKDEEYNRASMSEKILQEEINDKLNDPNEPERMSRRKLRLAMQPSIAKLKESTRRPDVVEWADVTSRDPFMLVALKSYRNTVPVPRHWNAKRKYLSGKRGFERPPFELPDFIKRTGIQDMREALWEKEESQNLKSKMRERARPKLGKIDIDYQKLHDAFFKWQTKPPMTSMGELYYEGKEVETLMKDKKPGNLSDDLRIALGMPVGPNAHKFPPPWLIAMQRYGPPPSYPNLRIAGLNAPIPEGCAFGYHAGGWGKPPVDDYGKPLYGDVFGQEPASQVEPEDETRIERRYWGEIGSDEDSDEESEPEEEEETVTNGVTATADGIATPMTEGMATPSGITTGVTGLETPDTIELRKGRRVEESLAGADTPAAAYHILPEKRVDRIGGQMMASTHVYDLSKKVAVNDGIEISLDPDAIDLDQGKLHEKYEEQLRKQTRAIEDREDLSDMVAEHAAGQNITNELIGETPESAPVEIESLCMNCEKNGTTRLLCTSIPYYKTVILMSFECPHCGFKNNEIQSGEAVQEHGTEIVLRVLEQVDLRRQMVKSEFASIEVPELELVIPAKTQPGEVTTVEGVLERVLGGLSQEQDRRRQVDPESAAKIDKFLEKLLKCKSLSEKWTLKLHDPTGNCFIQNPDPRHVDPRCIVSHYHRSLEERKLLGLAEDDVEEAEPAPEWKSYDDAKREVLHFPTDCPNCGAPAEVLMKPTDIPYFQTVIIMALTCDKCGHKSNEVKSGGSIKDHGCRLSITIKEDADLARDVLKSDTCSMRIPELDLEVGPGALCGRFTTVEGLLTATRDQLSAQSSFFMGDSAQNTERTQIAKFLDQFDDILSLKKVVTLVLDDPAGNSYIQSLSAPLEDPSLKKEFYERTWEQNEELGLNDMKVENYEDLDTVKEETEEETAV